VTLPLGEAVLITYEFHRPEPLAEVAVRQYSFLANSTQYILTVQGLPDDPTFVTDADSLASGWRLLE
jgi:hypothetical protein